MDSNVQEPTATSAWKQEAAEEEELDALIGSIKEPVFWQFPHEICTVSSPLMPLVQKRMRIVISQDGDGEAHIGSRNGVLGWGFGSSDVAVICGVGYAAHPEHLWQYLLYTAEAERGWEGNVLTEHGNHFEGLVRCVYELMTKETCYAGNMWRSYVDWLAEAFEKTPGEGEYLAWEIHSCSPDAVVLKAGMLLAVSRGIPCIQKISFAVEFKAPYGRLYDDIPIYYLLQVAWQLYTLLVPYIDFFAVRIGHIGAEDEGRPHEVLWIRVYWSAPLINKMLEFVEKFTRCLYKHEKPLWKHSGEKGEADWRSLARNKLLYRGDCPSDIAENVLDYWSAHKQERKW